MNNKIPLNNQPVPPAIESWEKVLHLQHQVNAAAQTVTRFKKRFGISLSVALFCFLFSWILAFVSATLFMTGNRAAWLFAAFCVAFGLCLVVGLYAMSCLQDDCDRLEADLRASASDEAFEAAIQKYLDAAYDEERYSDAVALYDLADGHKTPAEGAEAKKTA